MLSDQHQQMLQSEGFPSHSLGYFEDWGWRSIDAREASSFLGWEVESGGLLIPHGPKFFQIRLDSRKTKNGKTLPKYIGPKRTTPVPWIPPICSDEPIIATEGAKDTAAIALHSGYDVISLTGVTLWKTLEEYPSLEYLIYDADSRLNPKVFTQLIKAGRQLHLKIQCFPEVLGDSKAGACEYFKTFGSTQFEELLGKAQSPNDFLCSLPSYWSETGVEGSNLHSLVIAGGKLAKATPLLFKDYCKRITALFEWSEEDIKLSVKEDGKKRYSLEELIAFIEANYDLSFNELSQQIELLGEQLRDIETFYLSLAEAHSVSNGKQVVVDAVLYVAKKHSYHPVRNYLDRCSEVDPIPEEEWNAIATHYLGVPEDDYISNLFLQKFLISAVARIYTPGCKVDECLILQGPQGSRKSTFFATLGGEFFSDSLGDLSSVKDDMVELTSAWIHEWGEIERVTDKRSVGALKHFITKQRDSFRPPYGRSRLTFDRSCVITGTCNEDDFLRDKTGNRRYTVIPVGEIDIDLLKTNRQAIWSKAIELFKAGESWHYSKIQTELIERRAQDFAKEDSLAEEIEDYLEGREKVAVNDILADVLLLEPKDYKRFAYQAVNVLKSLGWTKDPRKRYSGIRKRYWFKPQHQETETSHCRPTPTEGVGRPEAASGKSSGDSVPPSHIYTVSTPDSEDLPPVGVDSAVSTSTDTTTRKNSTLGGTWDSNRSNLDGEMDTAWPTPGPLSNDTSVEVYIQANDELVGSWNSGFSLIKQQEKTIFSSFSKKLCPYTAVVRSPIGSVLRVALDDVKALGVPHE